MLFIINKRRRLASKNIRLLYFIPGHRCGQWVLIIFRLKNTRRFWDGWKRGDYLFLSRIKISAKTKVKTDIHIFSEIREGLNHLRRSPTMLSVILSVLALGTFNRRTLRDRAGRAWPVRLNNHAAAVLIESQTGIYKQMPAILRCGGINAQTQNPSSQLQRK